MNRLGKTILLIEDSEDDVFIFQRALKDARIGNPVQVASHGEQAIEQLSGGGSLPFIVFLDLKLPYIDGFDVLRWIRKQPHLDSIPVVVLTSSDEERDHSTAYQLGARSYIVKPPDGEQVLRLFRSLESYWARFETASPLLERLS